MKVPNTGLPLQPSWVPAMNRQAEIARKLAAELALPDAQRSRAGVAVPRSAALSEDEWSI